jgi:hypothetical protein
MKLPPSTTIIFSFAIVEEAEAKKRQKGHTNVKIGYSLCLVTRRFATIGIVVHLAFACYC